MVWRLSGQALGRHISARRQEFPGERVYAFQVERWAQDEVQSLEGVEGVEVRAAVSELALREVLEESEGGGTYVVLTPLEGSRLALDVRARLAGRGVFRLDPWVAVLPQFGVSQKDARLGSRRALGRALLESLRGPQEAPSGVLEEGRAWMALLCQEYQYPEGAVSVGGLLRWGVTRPEEVERLRDEEQRELRAELFEWVRGALGVAGELVCRVLLEKEVEGERVERGAAGARALRLGLSLQISCEARAKEKPAYLPEAREVAHQQAATTWEVRLEREFPILSPELGRWKRAEVEAAFAVVGREAQVAWQALRGEGAAQALSEVSQALDRDLERLSVPELSRYSAWSARGWEARLEELSEVLTSAPMNGGHVREALGELERHHARRSRPEEFERVVALARLAYRGARWPSARAREGGDLGALARWYVEEGSFEDQAREALAQREVGRPLRSVRERVWRGLGAERHQLGEAFARRLEEAESSGEGRRGVVRVEEVLEQVIRPLAQAHPVLWVVLDGLSWAVARALLEEGLREWAAWVPGARLTMLPMLSALPSVTQLSRASLLTGRLCVGGQAEERKGLEGAFEGRGGARLFHKAEVSGPAGLGERVREALSSPTRVVCVVVNAIDDQLSGATQLGARWTVEGISPLRALLDLAQDRVVVLCGDHGHVLEDGEGRQESARCGEGEERSARWRRLSGDVEGDEVAWRGEQASVFGRGPLALAWQEGVRYTGAQRGYHGGASVQEVVTPLVVLTRKASQDLREGGRFQALPSSPPGWWRFEEEREAASAPASPPPGSLLLERAPAEAPSWVEALLAHPLYKVQAREVLAPAQVRLLLSPLRPQRGGEKWEAHLSDVARSLSLPEALVRPQVEGLCRRLELDGQRVLWLDRGDERLKLEMSVLRERFGIEPDPAR